MQVSILKVIKALSILSLFSSFLFLSEMEMGKRNAYLVLCVSQL